MRNKVVRDYFQTIVETTYTGRDKDTIYLTVAQDYATISIRSYRDSQGEIFTPRVHLSYEQLRAIRDEINKVMGD